MCPRTYFWCAIVVVSHLVVAVSCYAFNASFVSASSDDRASPQSFSLTHTLMHTHALTHTHTHSQKPSCVFLEEGHSNNTLSCPPPPTALNVVVLPHPFVLYFHCLDQHLPCEQLFRLMYYVFLHNFSISIASVQANVH